jgi:hypothetical protein
MAKVMERVRSGGIAKGNPDQLKASKAANTVKNTRKTKKVDGIAAKKANAATKKALAAKLAQLEDKFLKKADISYLSHPRQWTDGVQGNATPLLSQQCVDYTYTEQGIGTGEVTDNDSTDTEDATGGLSQKVMASNVGYADEPEELSSDSEDSDNTGE